MGAPIKRAIYWAWKNEEVGIAWKDQSNGANPGHQSSCQARSAPALPSPSSSPSLFTFQSIKVSFQSVLIGSIFNRYHGRVLSVLIRLDSLPFKYLSKWSCSKLTFNQHLIECRKFPESRRSSRQAKNVLLDDRNLNQLPSDSRESLSGASKEKPPPRNSPSNSDGESRAASNHP